MICGVSGFWKAWWGGWIGWDGEVEIDILCWNGDVSSWGLTSLRIACDSCWAWPCCGGTLPRWVSSNRLMQVEFNKQERDVLCSFERASISYLRWGKSVDVMWTRSLVKWRWARVLLIFLWAKTILRKATSHSRKVYGFVFLRLALRMCISTYDLATE